MGPKLKIDLFCMINTSLVLLKNSSNKFDEKNTATNVLIAAPLIPYNGIKAKFSTILIMSPQIFLNRDNFV